MRRVCIPVFSFSSVSYSDRIWLKLSWTPRQWSSSSDQPSFIIPPSVREVAGSSKIALEIRPQIFLASSSERKEKSFKRLKSLTKFLLRFGIDIRRNVFDFILPKRLKLIVSGGAELNSKYVEKYKDLGIELLNGYGLTECSPIISVCRQIDNVAGSSGTILNHIDIKIAEDGEILVKGPNVMLGYYKNEELTKSVFEDGYFKTGDLGYKDEKNNKLYVTGRKSNLIILSNGKNVSPEVLEEEIIKFGYVEECLVTTDKSSHKSLIAKVYMDKQHEEEFKHDLDDLNSRNPSYMAIYKYEIMNERFEKNSNKKIKRSLYV